MRSDLHRTNIYLYSSDVDYLHHNIGFGWTERVRELVHEWVLNQRALERDTPPRSTLHPAPKDQTK